MKHSYSFIAILFVAFISSASAETFVTTSPVSALLTQQEHSVPATVESLNQTSLSAEISAKITHISVRVGDRVTKGTELIQLDCRSYQSRTRAQQASRNQLQAQRKLAASQLKRARNLKTGRTISEEDIERRESELASLDAQIAAQAQAIAQAELDTARCTISAPFNGVITRKSGHLGSLANPGTTLLEIVQLDNAEVNAELRESQANDLTNGQSATFLHNDKTYPITLRTLLPVVNSVSRTRAARFEFTDEQAPIGAAGRVVWIANRFLLPADYLQRRNDKPGVFLLKNNKAFFHVIDNALEGQPSPVDLPSDSLVIIDGRENLRHDDPVTLIKAEQ